MGGTTITGAWRESQKAIGTDADEVFGKHSILMDFESQNR
jgi:hypothetical protein